MLRYHTPIPLQRGLFFSKRAVQKRYGKVLAILPWPSLRALQSALEWEAEEWVSG